MHRCTATTKTGAQCLRSSQIGGMLCPQHEDKYRNGFKVAYIIDHDSVHDLVMVKGQRLEVEDTQDEPCVRFPEDGKTL